VPPRFANTHFEVPAGRVRPSGSETAPATPGVVVVGVTVGVVPPVSRDESAVIWFTFRFSRPIAANVTVIGVPGWGPPAQVSAPAGMFRRASSAASTWEAVALYGIGAVVSDTPSGLIHVSVYVPPVGVPVMVSVCTSSVPPPAPVVTVPW